LVGVVKSVINVGLSLCFVLLGAAALGIPEPAEIDLVKSTKKFRRDGKPELPMGVF